jgi:hypothetical protein
MRKHLAKLRGSLASGSNHQQGGPPHPAIEGARALETILKGLDIKARGWREATTPGNNHNNITNPERVELPTIGPGLVEPFQGSDIGWA